MVTDTDEDGWVKLGQIWQRKGKKEKIHQVRSGAKSLEERKRNFVQFVPVFELIVCVTLCVKLEKVKVFFAQLK